MVEDGCGGSAGERSDAGRVAGRDGMMQESTYYNIFGEGAQKQSCCFPFPPELIEPWYGNYLREYYGTLIEMMGCPIDYGWVAPVLRYYRNLRPALRWEDVKRGTRKRFNPEREHSLSKNDEKPRIGKRFHPLCLRRSISRW